jgi:hypothetical protein
VISRRKRLIAVVLRMGAREKAWNLGRGRVAYLNEIYLFLIVTGLAWSIVTVTMY